MREFRAINREYQTAILIVMHDGEIVEKGRVLDLFDSPQEEYTKRLLKASFEGAENCS